LKQVAVGGALAATLSWNKLTAAERKGSFPIGACDWSIGKGGDLAALELGKRIGLDGIQVSFGEPGGRYDLRKPEVRKEYEEAAKEQGVQVASMAMAILNQIPYSSDPRAEQWVSESVDVMEKMGQRIMLLAFFGKGDIKGKKDLQDEVIRRLKKVAPKADAAGVVLGLETWLDVDEHLRILDAVKSPAIQVYYDTANSNKMGYDIFAEIRKLGRERICQFHCKENGFVLGHGRIDFKKLKGAIDDIGYKGWLIIESAVGKGMNNFDSYTHNQKYLRSVFGG
jgi:L-ribulose-5-phosphate 3-epimerase